MPKEVKGIGAGRGMKLLKAWAEGTSIPHWSTLGGTADLKVTKRKDPRDRKAIKALRRRTEDFYAGEAWRELRYRALKMYGAKCACCGRTREHGVVLHVDHIQPRSRYPELALSLSNLQILCEDCNLGKSNRDSTDWRGIKPSAGQQANV